MCYSCGEQDKLTMAINSLWTVDHQRWALIKNLSGRLEVIPEISLEFIPEGTEIIYQLTPTQENNE